MINILLWRAVTVDKTKFSSVIQSVGESHDDFLARLREETRYCDFETLKTAAKPGKEFAKESISSTERP